MTAFKRYLLSFYSLTVFALITFFLWNQLFELFQDNVKSKQLCSNASLPNNGKRVRTRKIGGCWYLHDFFRIMFMSPRLSMIMPDCIQVLVEFRQIKNWESNWCLYLIKDNLFLFYIGPCASSHEATATDTKTEGKFGSNISHLGRYSDIAEKSMENFVSVISSFRFGSSGSRASGLRAPLKDVRNTCTNR